MLILGRHRDARRDINPRVTQVRTLLSSTQQSQISTESGDPLLQFLLGVSQVDQTQVFPSTALLLLPSTGRSQIPKTAAAAGGLPARSSPDMQNPKRKAEKTHLPKASREKTQTANRTYYEKHCATAATFRWPGAYVFECEKHLSVFHLHTLSQSPLGARYAQDGRHARYLVGLRGRYSFRALDKLKDHTQEKPKHHETLRLSQRQPKMEL